VLLLIYAVKCRIKHSRQKPQNNTHGQKKEKERSRTKKTKKKRLKNIQSFLHFFFLLFEDIKMGVTPSVSLATVKPPKTPFVLRKTAAPRRRNILSSWSSSFPPFPFRRKNPEKIVSVRRSSSSGTPKRSAGKKIIRVEKNRRKEEFQNWPVWGCAQSTFPWTYGQTEQCYILKGKVTVIPDENPEEAVTLEAGDFAEMQKGLSCTWDVLEDVSKNFKFV
jgi:uncharacterized cupin superfamily protein